MDYWSTFRQYQEQQKQAKAEREKQRAEQDARRRQEAEQVQARLEQERRETEQRQAASRLIAEHVNSEVTMIAEQETLRNLDTIAHDLRTANEQRQAALHEAAQRLQEQEAARGISPIEEDFYREWCESYPGIELKRQYPISRCRVDFAHVESMTIIELDGYIYHSRKKDRNRDYQRQHDLEELGWVFVRFTGSQIFADVEGCVRHAYKRIMARRG